MFYALNSFRALPLLMPKSHSAVVTAIHVEPTVRDSFEPPVLVLVAL